MHTPQVLGKHLCFLLRHMSGWSSWLLAGMGEYTYSYSPHTGGSDSAEDESYESSPAGLQYCPLILDYERGYEQFSPKDERFTQYSRTATSPISQAPASFRFLFARHAELQMDKHSQSEQEKETLRAALARQMLTSTETWNKTYASPRTRLPLPGIQHARAVVYGPDAS